MVGERSLLPAADFASFDFVNISVLFFELQITAQLCISAKMIEKS